MTDRASGFGPSTRTMSGPTTSSRAGPIMAGSSAWPAPMKWSNFNLNAQSAFGPLPGLPLVPIQAEWPEPPSVQASGSVGESAWSRKHRRCAAHTWRSCRLRPEQDNDAVSRWRGCPIDKTIRVVRSIRHRPGDYYSSISLSRVTGAQAQPSILFLQLHFEQRSRVWSASGPQST
jgi:hypothetical protein